MVHAESQQETTRLTEALRRLGMNKAFDLPTADVSDELKMRMDFARAAVKDD